MRRAAKVDRNQAEIVAALRKIGASVAITSAIGGGFPDLVAGYRRRNTLIEVKDGEAQPSDRRLTPAQERFFEAWRGRSCVVETVEQALYVVRSTPDAERELLLRIVKSAREDGAVAPGFTRLAMALEDAERFLQSNGGVR